MKIRLLVVIVSLIIFVPTGANAQMKGLLKKLGQEATKAVVNEKVEEKKVEESGKEVNPGQGIMGMLGMGGDVNHRDIYQFDGKIVMIMETYKDNKVDGEIEYITFINTENSDVAIEVKPLSGEAASGGTVAVNIIYDQENSAVLMIYDMDGQKTAMASSFDDDIEASEEESDYEVDETHNYTKTGRTKKIAGYSCEEYIMDDGESRVNMWVTDDLPFKPAKKEMMKAGVPLYNNGPLGGGMVMEMDMFEEGEQQVKMTVKEVDASAGKSISLVGYTFMNMGGRK